MGSGVGHVEQGEGPDDQEPEDPKAHAARKPRVIDLVIGRDSPKVFPELRRKLGTGRTILSSVISRSAQGR